MNQVSHSELAVGGAWLSSVLTMADDFGWSPQSRFRTDIAIRDGKIARIGNSMAPRPTGDRRCGSNVAPCSSTAHSLGFQVFQWDPYCSPRLALGDLGVMATAGSFAPVRADRDGPRDDPQRA